MDKENIKLAAGYRAFYGKEFLLYSIKSIYPYVERIIIALSKIPHSASFKRQKPDITADFIRKFCDSENKIEIIEGSWGARSPFASAETVKEAEAGHSNAILNYVREKYPCINYLLTIDTDEIFTEESITGLMKVIKKNPDTCGFNMVSKIYWKGLHYILEESEPGYLPIAVKIMPDVEFTQVRSINKKNSFNVPPDIYYHHPSYARSSEAILKKIKTFSHAKEIRKDWYKNVWQKWDKNKDLPNLHPLFDGSWWKRAIRVNDADAPQIIRNHPYFQYETVDEFENSAKEKEKTAGLWIPQ